MSYIEREMRNSFCSRWRYSNGNTKVRHFYGCSFVLIKDKIIAMRKGNQFFYARRGESKLIDNRLKALGADENTPMQSPLALESLYNIAKNYGRPSKIGWVVKSPTGKPRYFCTEKAACKWARERGRVAYPIF